MFVEDQPRCRVAIFGVDALRREMVAPQFHVRGQNSAS